MVEIFLKTAPKVELHLHLEGSIRDSTATELAQRYRLPLEGPPVSDWSSFLARWKSVCALLRRVEDFERLVVELGQDLARQRVVYAEVFFSPEPHTRHHGFNFDDLFAALERGRREVHRRWSVELRWLADGVRDSSTGPLSCQRTVDWMCSLKERGGLLGLGLGGNEETGPPALFADAFAQARAAGFMTVAHAGESVNNIAETLSRLQVSRIGHGLQAIGCAATRTLLKEAGVTLEVCPTSNLTLGHLDSVESLRPLLNEGVLCCLNSDDPGILNTTLTRELLLVSRALHLDLGGAKDLLTTAVESSFAPAPWKSKWKNEIEDLYQQFLEQGAHL